MKQKNNLFTKHKYIIFALLAIGGLIGIGFFQKQRSELAVMKSKIIPAAVEKVTSGGMKIKEISDIKLISGVYEFGLTFEGNAVKYTSYITRDGKIVFTSGVKLETVAGKTNTQTTPQATKEQKLTCDDVKKSDKPQLTVYIVSNCPFGLQMQRVMKVAAENDPRIADNFFVKYIGSIENGKIISMHGDKEAQENLRQICIRDEQQALYWPYVNCYMKEGKSDECLASSGISQDQLTACTTDAKRGLVYAQKDFDSAKVLGVSGSPTLLLNDKDKISEFDFGGRTPDALKQIICCASTAKSDFCQKDFSKEAAAASFSLSDTAPAGGSSSANCGN